MYTVTSPSSKKPEKDLSVKNVGRGFGKLCVPLSPKILAMALCFIAEGYQCLLSYLRQESILYCRVNDLKTSIVWIWSLDIMQILYVISKDL